MKRFKAVVFIVRQTWVLAYFPLLLQFFELPFFIFDLLFSAPFATNAMLDPGPYNHIARTSLRPGEEFTETIWRAANMVSTCRNTFNFFDSLVIFRHYLTGNGKVSRILATISD